MTCVRQLKVPWKFQEVHANIGTKCPKGVFMKGTLMGLGMAASHQWLEFPCAQWTESRMKEG